MLLLLALASALVAARAKSDEARIVIDAAQVEGPIAPRLYGQFVEFMFEGVKGGLAAELVYPAEEYHQDYYIKSFRQYWSYRAG